MGVAQFEQEVKAEIAQRKLLALINRGGLRQRPRRRRASERSRT